MKFHRSPISSLGYLSLNSFPKKSGTIYMLKIIRRGNAVTTSGGELQAPGVADQQPALRARDIAAYSCRVVLSQDIYYRIEAILKLVVGWRARWKE